MITLTLVDSTPNENPDLLLVKATFSGNYGVNGVGDTMNLAAIADPKLLGKTALLGLAPTTPLMVLSESIGGSYVQPTLPAAPTLANFTMQMYEPGGAEKATNAAYTAPELAGFVLLGIKIPPAC